MRALSVLLSGTAVLTLAASVPPKPVPLANPGFESGLQGWTVTGGKGGVSTAAKTEGAQALRLEAPAEGGEVKAEGPSVKLQVGRLYRLSAWVKPEGVRLDGAARYPTAQGACLSMASFPFTNASGTVAAAEGRVSVTFFATTATDRVQLNLGRNGKAFGAASFDDVRLEEVDVTQHIPMEKVRWHGPAFRYDEGGWTFVHVEGEPYARGYQHGRLLAAELAALLEKLAISADRSAPEKGWGNLRLLADALMLRKFDPEFLEEMKGIADGAAKGGAAFKGRKVDLLDVVTMNSAIDLGQLDDGLRTSLTPLSGRSFLKAEDEAEKAGKGDHCSAFVATKTATKDGRFVTGQMFMWNGYTGVHWDVILDIVPAKGHRLVMQTFPGGIHSGTDWYLNGAGLVIGETTVGQTPFNPEGTPQSNRIRKAAQYASSIDDVARILTERNNGLYTNDWTIADAKTDEGAVFLLGTAKTRLWRTGSKGKPADTPGNLKDFVWANNNNRDLEVRKEYILNPENTPVDLAFNTWNRDIAFWDWFKGAQGKIDLAEAIRFWATSPVQRPHACDGKLTTAEMAEKLMFIAHQGKTTMREKWVGGRYIADLPNALPHMTYGYTAFSPIYVADALKAARAIHPVAAEPTSPKVDATAVKGMVGFDAKLLWQNTVVPATDAENWLSSGDAALHGLLRRLPAAPEKGFEAQRDAFADLNARYLFFAQREGETAPLKTATAYDRYGAYQHPRIKGTVALNQLRLWLGNEAFAKVMAKVHEAYAGKPIRTEDFLKVASEAAGKDVRPLVMPWLTRTGLPDPALEAKATQAGEGWEVAVTVTQKAEAWPFVATLALRTAKGVRVERIEVTGAEARATYKLTEKPLSVTLGSEAPVASAVPAALPNLLDQWENLLFVRGTGRFPEASHSLALRFREVVADTFTDVVLPMKADGEVTEADLRDKDLVLLGGIEDNAVLARLASEAKLPVALRTGAFTAAGRTYARADEGVAFAVPSPWNAKRMLYVYAANNPLQLWRMTKGYQRGLPGWAVWRGDEVVAKGFHGSPALTVSLE